MRYRIVTDGGRGKTIVDDIDMLTKHVRGRGWHFDGIYENSQTRAELQGHPIVRELDGPSWWEEGDCVMYEEKGLVLQSAMGRTGAKVTTSAAPWGRERQTVKDQHIIVALKSGKELTRQKHELPRDARKGGSVAG